MTERSDDVGTRRPGASGSGPIITRRQLLKAGAVAGTAGVVAGTMLRPGQARLLDRLTGLTSGAFDPAQVQHVVVLMQENRSFDHYFGTLAGVRGFADPDAGNYATGVPNAAPFVQAGPLSALPGWAGPTDVGGDALLQSWQLVTNLPTENGQSTNDISHEWGTQHLAWNGGAMNQWFAAHAGSLSSNPDAPEDMNKFPLGIPLAPAPTNDGYMTMGYLAQPDLAFYHALADAFTICDGYFCSVLGPTDPNRLMLMSNSIGIEFGTPMLETLVQTRPQAFGSIGWKTMPEALNGAGGPKNPLTAASGVSWKVYGDPTAQLLFNVLPYFKQYQSDAQLAANAFAWQYPANFLADVAAGTLPQVSWLLPPANACEHPAAPPSQGEDLVYQVLTALTANPAVWAHTVLFVVYDENGGWFDHVPPPTPSFSADISGNAKNSGEWLGSGVGGTTTVTGPSAGTYEEGPLGLGFRTPCLVISPFSQGGFVCSPYFKTTSTGPVQLDPAGTFDHTSINRFIATVFNGQGYEIELPNLSPWRAGVTGDFTRAFPGVVAATAPSFTPPVSTTDVEAAVASVINGLAGTVSEAPLPYPPPTNNAASWPPPTDGKGLAPTYSPPA
jgi:phospholipase C